MAKRDISVINNISDNEPKKKRFKDLSIVLSLSSLVSIVSIVSIDNIPPP